MKHELAHHKAIFMIYLVLKLRLMVSHQCIDDVHNGSRCNPLTSMNPTIYPEEWLAVRVSHVFGYLYCLEDGTIFACYFLISNQFFIYTASSYHDISVFVSFTSQCEQLNFIWVLVGNGFEMIVNSPVKFE